MSANKLELFASKVPGPAILAPVTALLAVGATAGNGNAFLAGAVLGVAVLLMNILTTRPGGMLYLMQVIFLAMWTVSPSVLHGKDPTASGNLIAIGLTVFAVALWMACIGGTLRTKMPAGQMPVVPMKMAVISGIICGVVVGGATYYVIADKLGHSGFWMILTIAIVFHPLAVDPWTKAAFRVIGTFLGFALAFAIIWLLPRDAPLWAYLIPALVLAYAMMVGFLDPRGSTSRYWVAVTFLTSFIVILEGGFAGHRKGYASILKLDDLRLEYTLIGVGVALIGIAIVYPFRKYILAPPPVTGDGVSATSA